MFFSSHTEEPIELQPHWDRLNQALSCSAFLALLSHLAQQLCIWLCFSLEGSTSRVEKWTGKWSKCQIQKSEQTDGVTPDNLLIWHTSASSKSHVLGEAVQIKLLFAHGKVDHSSSILNAQMIMSCMSPTHPAGRATRDCRFLRWSYGEEASQINCIL
jgi:hypothetical protein